MFDLVSKYAPSGDQPEAIHQLIKGIKEVRKPPLVLAHNKTLAGQLYSELNELFPNNHVCYFVSYYRNTLKTILFQHF